MNGFNEKPQPQTDQESKIESTQDPYADWTDEQRSIEYAHTGDPQYLTPALARKMQVSPETMHQVSGATEDDIRFAESVTDEDIEFVPDEFSDRYEVLMHSISDSELNKLPTPENVLQRLLDVATIPIEEQYDLDLVDDNRLVVDEAISKILRFLYSHSDSVYKLFESMRHFEPQGVRDVEVMHEVYRRTYRNFVELSHSAELTDEQKNAGHDSAQVLNEFVATAKEILSATEVPSDANYLTAKYLERFAYMIGISEDGHIDQDSFLPFEIEAGRLAVFSDDGLRLYVADTQYSDKINERLTKLKKQIHYREQGQFFARHISAEVPAELWDLIDEFKNVSLALEDIGGGNLSNSNLLRDYISFLRSDTRKIIEDEFGFKLKNLSIGEQFYFLNFLKGVTVQNAERVQEFTKHFGILGMRTFLVLEELGTEYGDTIINFGLHQADLADEHSAEVVFSHFLKIHSATESAGQYLETEFGQTRANKQLIHEITTKIRKRAAKFLNELLKKPLGNTLNSYNTIISAIKESAADTILFTSSFKTLKQHDQLNLETIRDTRFESLPADTLALEDIEMMLEILEKNWQGESAEFIAEIKQSLRSATQNEHSTFYVLRHKGKIVGFNRFDDYTHNQEKPRLYFGSFNTDPEFGNGKLGEAIYEESLKRELGKEAIIEADCDPFSPITKKYLESGFVATNFILYGHKPSLHIVCDKDIQQATGETITRKIRVGDRFTELSGDVVLTRLYEEGRELYGEFKKISPALKQKVTPHPQN